MDPLTYSVSFSEHDLSIVTVHLNGELDAGTSRGLRRVLAGLAFKWLILDCEGLAFVDSSGINLFLAMHRECETSMRRLTFVHVPDPVRRVFDVAGISDVLDLA